MTLGVRVVRQDKYAIKIAEWSKRQPTVTDVYYVGLPDHPGHARHKSQATGFGSMISFKVKSPELAIKVLGRLKLIAFAESLGGVESLLTYPIAQTHAEMPKELLARINAVLRRSEIPEDTHKRLTFDKLLIDLDSYELIVDGKKIDTPPKELELLYHLAATPNRVYTRNQLLDEVWGFDYFGDSRTVDVHVKRLREKVENVSDQWALKTVWGVG